MNQRTSAYRDPSAPLRQIAKQRAAEQGPCDALNDTAKQNVESSSPLGSRGDAAVRPKRIVKSHGFFVNANGNSPEFTEAKLVGDYALIEELGARLSEVEGQAYAVQAVKEYLFGINGREVPHGVAGLLTFIGPPAVGKTLLGERIAEALHRPYLRLDMSGFNDHEVGMCDLFGVNKSYKAAERGTLTAFVEDNPVSVVMLDEFEKAHSNVQNRFLQIFDRGEAKDLFTESNVSFRNVIVIVTMNLGKQLYDRSLATYNLSNIPQPMIVKALRKETDPLTQAPYLSDALISRLSMGKIILFNKLRPEIVHRITVGAIQKAEMYYGDKYGLEFQIDESMLAKLILLGIGEQADVRTAIKAVKEFFAQNLVRMVEMNRGEKRRFTTLRCVVDETADFPEAEKIFHSHNKTHVLVCCKRTHRAMFRSFDPDRAEVLFAEDEKAMEEIRSGDISLAILDAEEEKKTFSGRLFEALTEMEVIPVYVYASKAKSDVPLLFYSDRGAVEVFRGSPAFLMSRIGELLNGSELTDLVQTLSRANKVIRFETSYSFEAPQTAVLNISHINAVLAQEADDIEKFTARREIPNIRFDDIYGAKDAKAEMLRILNILRAGKKYHRQGLRLPRGVLLTGSPGNGKTMLAKAFACEAQLPFIHKNASEFKQKWQGEGARMIRELFAVARKYAPAVVFIDEIDAIARSREDSVNEGSTEALNALLSEMDGFSDNTSAPVFLIAATNFNFKKDETCLDPALLRRFDRKIHIELPDAEVRKQYLSDRLSAYHNDVSVRMIENLAKRSIGWSFGELDNVLQNALREAYSEGGRPISDALLNEAFEKYTDGECKPRSEQEVRQTAIHEAGHAVVAAALGLMPSYATIGARSGYGGYVYYGDETMTVLSRGQCLDRIAIMLAGREAEVAFYGEAGVTSGASNDLKSATELATNMVCDYGMDESFPIYIEQTKRSSPQVMRRIAAIVKAQAVRVHSLIEANREKVRSVADALLEKVNLDQTDIRNLTK